MPQIEVAKPFTLTLANGEQKNYQPGKYEVSDEVTHHWFTLPHLKKDKQEPAQKHPHEGDTSATGIVPEKTIEETAAAAAGQRPASEDPVTASALTVDPLLDTEPTTAGKTKKGS